MNLVN